MWGTIHGDLSRLDDGIVLHNQFQASENQRVERGRVHTVSVMNVQIRAAGAKP
jgi:hypothetical protein